MSDMASKIQKGDAKMIDSAKLRKKYKIKMWLYHVRFIIEVILFNSNEPNHLTLRNWVNLSLQTKFKRIFENNSKTLEELYIGK